MHAQACPTLRHMTHFVCQFHTSDCSMCMAEVIYMASCLVRFVMNLHLTEFGETSSLSWTGLITQTIPQNTRSNRLLVPAISNLTRLPLLMKTETYNQSIGIMNDHWLLLSSVHRPSRLNVSVIILMLQVGNLNH